jgi:hypothetical protein
MVPNFTDNEARFLAFCLFLGLTVTVIVGIAGVAGIVFLLYKGVTAL